MSDTFIIGAYWKDRKQLLDSIITPTLQTLKRLSEIDEQFFNLYELGNSRKEALDKKALLSPQYIEKLYQKRIKRNDLDPDGYSKVGYRLSLWTGHKDGEASNISFGVGKSSDKLTNVCLIQLPFQGIAKDRLLHFDKIKEIITVLIQNWDPDVVVLNSTELSNKLKVMNDVGWITYRKKLKGKVKLSNKVIHDNNFLSGHLFYLNGHNVYDYSLMDELVPVTKIV